MTTDPPLTIERLRTMSTADVLALDPGEVNRVLAAGTRHDTSPLTPAELADLDHVPYRRVAANLAQAEQHLADQQRSRADRDGRDAEAALALAELDRIDTPAARYRAALIRQAQKETR